MINRFVQSGPDWRFDGTKVQGNIASESLSLLAGKSRDFCDMPEEVRSMLLQIHYCCPVPGSFVSPYNGLIGRLGWTFPCVKYGPINRDQCHALLLVDAWCWSSRNVEDQPTSGKSYIDPWQLRWLTQEVLQLKGSSPWHMETRFGLEKENRS
jgi:hypothetical protein